MIASKLVGFDAAKIKEQMFKNASEEQTRRLVEFAKDEIQVLGNRINSYNGAHHLDRTGNLLNSLCWGVCYNGEMKESGFYRDEAINSYTNRWGQTRGLSPSGGSESFLHEWSNPTGEQVVGRKRAERFLQSYKGKEKGWTVFFAILAPYWGYWEKGFTMRGGGSTVYHDYPDSTRKIPHFSRFYQFQAIVYVYDDMRMALKKPAVIHPMQIHVPTYSYKARSAKGRKYKNRPFTKKLGKIE